MKLNNVIDIKVPDSYSHYRLCPCRCGSDNVAYVLWEDGRWRGHCFDCGHSGPGAIVRHEAQVDWNKRQEVAS